MTDTSTRRSPLDDLHRELGARMVDFSGWGMPVQYQGVIAEHRAVRTSCGVFDVSHLGRFAVRGPGSTAVLRRLLCNDVANIEPGRAQYTMMLNDRGGVEDDIIVWRWDEEDFWVLPNAGNMDDVVGAFREAAAQPDIEPLRDGTVMLAVQGPDAPALLERELGLRPRRFRVGHHRLNDSDVWAAGTGYTGEAGAELVVPGDRGETIMRRLLQAGATPAGLGARDTLRLEMGYPLWGQDLDPDTTPLEADLEWVVDWDHDFIGRAALDRQRRNGLPKSRVAFIMEGREIPRQGYPLSVGESTGSVTSGNFSPTLGRGIGMGYVGPPAHDGGEVLVEIRGKQVPARSVDTPFITQD